MPTQIPLPASVRPTASNAWVAKVLYTAAARTGPRENARPRHSVPAVSQWGTPMELLVLDARVDSGGRGWLKVMLDERPNGSTVWIAAEDTVLHSDPWRIVVSRARRTVQVLRGGKPVHRFSAVVGTPATPTPAGLFAIAAELAQPNAAAFEGSWVLPLTAHSNVLQSFEGGNGQVALHGRGGASLADPLGSASSHGCVRLSNSAVDWIAARVPLGTPVRVS